MLEDSSSDACIAATTMITLSLIKQMFVTC